MAVTAQWFGPQILGQYSGTSNMVIDWDADDIRTALATSASSVSAANATDTFDFFNDVTGEVSGTGYTAFGYAHATQTASLDTATDEIRLDLDDASWTTASFTARYAVIYRYNSGTASTSALAGLVNFGADETVASGTFTIQWDSTGALKIDYT